MPWFRVVIVVEGEAETLEDLYNRILISLPPGTRYYADTDTPKYVERGVKGRIKDEAVVDILCGLVVELGDEGEGDGR